MPQNPRTGCFVICGNVLAVTETAHRPDHTGKRRRLERAIGARNQPVRLRGIKARLHPVSACLHRVHPLIAIARRPACRKRRQDTDICQPRLPEGALHPPMLGFQLGGVGQMPEHTAAARLRRGTELRRLTQGRRRYHAHQPPDQIPRSLLDDGCLHCIARDSAPDKDHLAGVRCSGGIPVRRQSPDAVAEVAQIRDRNGIYRARPGGFPCPALRCFSPVRHRILLRPPTAGSRVCRPAPVRS